MALLHLFEVDGPSDAASESTPPDRVLRRGGDLSALALAAFLRTAAPVPHVRVVLGHAGADARAERLDVRPDARVPTPAGGSVRLAARGLQRVLRDIEPAGCVAWSGFAAAVARRAGVGGSLGAVAAIDPHGRSPADTAEAIKIAQCTSVPDRGDHGERPRVLLLADPGTQGRTLLPWRGVSLASAGHAGIDFAVPPACSGLRRLLRMPTEGLDLVRIDVDGRPLHERLAAATVALAVHGPDADAHASPGLVAAALSAGLHVVADPRHAPVSLHDNPGLVPCHRAATAEVARALLDAMAKRPRRRTTGALAAGFVDRVYAAAGVTPQPA
ncbi:MAG: hypothetical protein AAFX79_06320 [Planctomycetota bacterium]